MKTNTIISYASILTIVLLTGCGEKTAAVGNPASVDELNRALAVLSMRGGQMPPSTNDLAKFLALSGKTLPVPPPGKRLMFDSNKGQFVIANP
jgi:hypothetical protein